MNNCKYCKADCALRGEENLKECTGHIPMTNAGRIRSMTDEEFADALQKFCIGMVDCSDCPLYAFGCPVSSIFNDWLEWLQQPAEGE